MVWRVITLSRLRDTTQDRILFWTYLLSTIVELVVLVLQFVPPFLPKNGYDAIHFGTGSIRTVLLLILVSLSYVANTRPIRVSDVEPPEPQSNNFDRCGDYGTFHSAPACPPSTPPPTPDRQSGSVSFSQHVKVALKFSRLIQVFGRHICSKNDRLLQFLATVCFSFMRLKSS